MFKIGDIVAFYLGGEWFKVIRLDALGFEVVRVSGHIRRARQFYEKSKVKKYWKNTDQYRPQILVTKEIVQKELDAICLPYIEFMKGLP